LDHRWLVQVAHLTAVARAICEVPRVEEWHRAIHRSAAQNQISGEMAW